MCVSQSLFFFTSLSCSLNFFQVEKSWSTNFSIFLNIRLNEALELKLTFETQWSLSLPIKEVKMSQAHKEKHKSCLYHSQPSGFTTNQNFLSFIISNWLPPTLIYMFHRHTNLKESKHERSPILPFLTLFKVDTCICPLNHKNASHIRKVPKKIPKIGQNMSLNVFYALLFIYQRFVHIFSHNQYNHQIASINLTPTQDTIWMITILSTDCKYKFQIYFNYCLPS